MSTCHRGSAASAPARGLALLALPALLGVLCPAAGAGVAAGEAAGDEAAAVPPYSDEEARVFASLAQAAYCGHAGGDRVELKTWSCGPCVDSGVQVVEGSVQVIEEPDELHEDALIAYVARLSGTGAGYSSLGDACLLSIRGTAMPANWERDLQFWREPFPNEGCQNCRAEHGFLRVWEKVQPQVLAALAEIGCVPEGAPLHVTGHSLGAAAGTLAMIALRGLGYRVASAYLFESPRVGDSYFRDAFMEAFNATTPAWRFTHAYDPVPDVPPVALGYRHVGYQVHYDTNGTFHVCQGSRDPKCRRSLPRDLRHPADHCATNLTPVGRICGCYNSTREVMV